MGLVDEFVRPRTIVNPSRGYVNIHLISKVMLIVKIKLTLERKFETFQSASLPVSGSSHRPPMPAQGQQKPVETSFQSFVPKICSKVGLSLIDYNFDCWSHEQYIS